MCNKLFFANKLNLLLMACCGFFVSCKKPTHVNYGGYILGPESNILLADDNSLSSIPNDDRESSVLIAIRVSATQEVKFCSATALSQGGFLSSHHCFAVETTVGNQTQATAQLLPDACKNTTIYFNFRKDNADNAQTLPCKDGSLRTDFTGDVSYFEADGKLPSGVTGLKVYDGSDDESTQTAYLIHYPDVQANYVQPKGLNFSLPAMAVTTKNCSVTGPFAPGEQTQDQVLPESIQTTCDLTHGSSGSGLIDVNTHEILGVVWGGIEFQYAQGMTRTINGATDAAYVRAFLAKDQAKMAALAKSTPQAGQDSDDAVASSKDDGGSTKAGIGRVKLSCGTVAENTRTQIWWLLIVICLPILYPFIYEVRIRYRR